MQVRQHLFVKSPHEVRGHDAQNHVRAFQSGREIARNLNVSGELETGKVNVVLTRHAHALRQVCFVDPEAHPRETRRQHDGKRGSPAAGAYNRQIFQDLRAPKVNTLSLPARRRRILLLCL